MIDAQQVGGKIAALRKSRNMTQTELAERLRVTHQAVSKWERGVSMPDVQNLVDLSGLFHVTVDYVLGVSDIGGDAHAANGEAAPLVKQALLSEGEMERVWSETLTLIRRDISKPSYDTWLKHTEAYLEGGQVVIVCRTPYQKQWLHSRYSGRILQALEQVTGIDDIKIGFRTRNPGDTAASFPFPKERAELLD
ncbi:helix-turn-helix domain-containing protein [Paenibacillus mesophilus]|uniref:helix-turn-helix domain-containing protein n=1 Tax=Paenibacillus mesophilus TaxID=2582849 RepID=UPI0013053DA7|nr:helix-turn-helix transcriptional regulator [Paenibacillus mesophilus]